MSKNQQYVEQYKEAAMEQMRRYGIPASVTLAQGILESSNGQSQLARNENNHFGIKATSSWIANGGKYGLYTDDKPNEKFCSYASVGDSYEHHSQFLRNNKRYAACFSLSPDNYKGWAQGLDRAGYATAGTYTPNLIKIIERNDLAKYDLMVLEEMKAQGKQIGVEQNPRTTDSSIANTNDSNHSVSMNTTDSNYSFPLKRNEFILVTSPFGMRSDPTDSSKQQMHKGIDIRTKQDDILATEDKGKVVAVNQNANTAGGKSVTVEYQRENGDKVQLSYLHLSSVDVKVGDEVNAGKKLGVTGNTGTRTTGEHLHLSVKQIAADGTTRDLDPAAYLAEIAEKGNIQLKALSNGEDLLAKYKTNNTPEIDTTLSPDDWMKKILSSEDSGEHMSMGDPIVEMAMTLFTSLMALAVQIDNKSESEKMQTATDAALNKRIDLSSLLPGMKGSALVLKEDGKTVLEINNGKQQFSHELTPSELNRLSQVLNNAELSDDVKRQRLSGIVNSIVVAGQVSQNYEQQQNQTENHNEVIRR